jgi:hypothetical protein
MGWWGKKCVYMPQGDNKILQIAFYTYGKILIHISLNSESLKDLSTFYSS